MGFPDGPVVKNLPCNARDLDLILGWGNKIAHARATKPTFQSPRTIIKESVRRKGRLKLHTEYILSKLGQTPNLNSVKII